ncbi:nitrate ABC transporter substrate-binding protein, partial [Halobacteriales archaeon SW_5_68_122]
MVHISRRRLLQTGAATIGTAGIAGCVGQGGGSLDSLTVAYVPIYPNMQHYVMERESYYGDVP